MLILSAQGNYLFSTLPEADLESTCAAMRRVEKQPGDIIIRQGHKGTEFFVLEKGRAEVRMKGPCVCAVCVSGL